MAEHSRFGGSTADRWLNCAASTALIATVPSSAESPYAREGSCAHALAAECLAKGSHPAEWKDFCWSEKDGFTSGPAPSPDHVLVTQEMIDAVTVYLNAVTHEMARTKEAELYVEQGFVLDVKTAEPGTVFGTNDAMVYHPKTGRLVVFDYKHGVGVSVTADDNAQLKFYAAGAVFSKPDWRIAELELVIVQPRARDVDDLGAVRVWPMKPIELMDFLNEVEDAIKRTSAPEALYASGKWCRWCDAASVCPLREQKALEACGVDFKDMTEITADALPDYREFDVERLGKTLAGAQILNAWLNQIMEHVEALVVGGNPVPGWKLVQKIGRAKWVAADREVSEYAELMFGVAEDDIRPRKLTTIGEAEKLLKAAGASKDDLDSFKLKFTVKDSSGLTIAPESDRRPAVNAAERDFGDLKI